jgi:hypothetical protein
MERWKLENLDIPKILVELLQINSFTIETILDYGPSQIAKILGIDLYVGEIIFKETKKAVTKVNPILLTN